MYTSNTSIAWTSPEKTDDSVVKSTGQEDLAMLSSVWFHHHQFRYWQCWWLAELQGTIGKKTPNYRVLCSFLFNSMFPCSSINTLFISPLWHSVMRPSLEHGLIGTSTLSTLSLDLPCFVYRTVLVHTVQPIFLTVSFPPSSFCSRSLRDPPFMSGSYALPWPPSVFMLHVFYLYPLPAALKLIVFWKSLVVTPQTTHTPLIAAGMRASNITLNWSSGLAAGLSPVYFI